MFNETTDPRALGYDAQPYVGGDERPAKPISLYGGPVIAPTRTGQWDWRTHKLRPNAPGTRPWLNLGGDMAPPPAPTNAPDVSASSSVPQSTPVFDIAGFLQGSTFGLPTWLVVGAAAWFFFFRKGR